MSMALAELSSRVLELSIPSLGIVGLRLLQALNLLGLGPNAGPQIKVERTPGTAFSALGPQSVRFCAILSH